MKFSVEKERTRLILSQRGSWVISVVEDERYKNGYSLKMFYQIALAPKELHILESMQKVLTPKAVRGNKPKEGGCGNIRSTEKRVIFTIQDAQSLEHLFDFLEEHPLDAGKSKRKAKIFESVYTDFVNLLPGCERKMRQAQEKIAGC